MKKAGTGIVMAVITGLLLLFGAVYMIPTLLKSAPDIEANIPKHESCISTGKRLEYYTEEVAKQTDNKEICTDFQTCFPEEAKKYCG